MALTPNDLLADPLFQLNAVLWLAQPLPKQHDVTPLLFQQGFTVYAIAPLLAPPPDVRLAAQVAEISMQERTRPDVVLSNERDGKFAFVECKASSFTLASSDTPEQARTLLVVAGPRAAEVLGLTPQQLLESLLVFVTPETGREQLAQTLADLSKELGDNRLPAGRSSVLGLTCGDNDVSIVVNDEATRFFGLVAGSNPFIIREPDTDPRPLYFLPYDPDVDQTDGERAFCKRVLFERMHGTVIAAVGHANPPAQLTFESARILNDAMLGMYGHWQNPDSAKHMRALCRQLMVAIAQAVNSVVVGTMVFQSAQGWTITLHDQEHQEKVMDALDRFSCSTLDLRGKPEPGLFDGFEDDLTTPAS